METRHNNEILEIFKKGTELNIGILPNTKTVKYGHNYINDELILYIKSSDEAADLLQKCIDSKKAVHFNKWANNGKFVTGYGNITILEINEEKVDGLNYILKQEAEQNINQDEIKDISIYKIIVEKTYLMKTSAAVTKS